MTHSVAAVLLALAAAPLAAAETGPLLATIKSVGREGAGNAEAGKAWRALVKMGAAALPDLLAGMDGTEDSIANWLRLAVDAVAENEIAAGRKLPADVLEAHVRDTKRGGASRRLAYEWLCKADPAAPERIIPGLLDDPAAEMRRDAVALAIKDAEAVLAKGDKSAASAAFAKALHHARDTDQVRACIDKLKGLGVRIDPAGQFGLLRSWKLVGPFDGPGTTGYGLTFAPEEKLDPELAGTGKNGAALKWIDHATADPDAMVDLNKALGKHKGAVAYALASVDSPAERAVEIRLGTPNGVKVYLNGARVFAFEEYHHVNVHIDQYVCKATLKAGRNDILVKVCQNEQTEVWAQDWKFQLRVCDSLGAPVPLTVHVEKKK